MDKEKKQEAKTEEEHWLRPCDIKQWRESNPAKMKGYYLAERLMRSWSEDFIDQDTGEVVSVERNEVILRNGTLLNRDNLQQVQFYLSTGDIKDVLISESPLPSHRYWPEKRTKYLVTFYNFSERNQYVVLAHFIEEALQIAFDFGVMYRYISDFNPIKVSIANFYIIWDTDPCIPEDERIPEKDPKTYFECKARLEYYDKSELKNVKKEWEYLVAANDVGQAKERVFNYHKKSLDDMEGSDEKVNISFKVIKAVSSANNVLVPLDYCMLYKGKANDNEK